MKQDKESSESLQEAWRRTPDGSPPASDAQRTWRVSVYSPKQTERLAACLGGIVPRGGILVLDGDLGAGKTTFVRGLARGLGLDEGIVSSPTFTLIHEYDGDKPLYHFDAYRLDAPEEFFALGAEEYLYGDGVCAIEWGRNVASELPAERLEIELRTPTPDLDEGRLKHPTGPGGRPLTRGCGGADHWNMTEDDLDAFRRDVEIRAYGSGPEAWLARLREAWEIRTGGRSSSSEESKET